MKLLADKDIKRFFLGVTCVMAVFLLLSQMVVWMPVPSSLRSILKM